jgi:hypothetical protein
VNGRLEATGPKRELGVTMDDATTLIFNFFILFFRVPDLKGVGRGAIGAGERRAGKEVWPVALESREKLWERAEKRSVVRLFLLSRGEVETKGMSSTVWLRMDAGMNLPVLR